MDNILQTLHDTSVAMSMDPMVSNLMLIATLLTLVFAGFHYYMLLRQPKLDSMDFVKLIRREELIAIIGAFILERVGLALTLIDRDFIFVNLMTKIMLMAVFMIAAWTMSSRLRILKEMAKQETEEHDG